METSNLIMLEELCSLHNIELEFINSLSEFGLIEVLEHQENKYVAHHQLKDLEKMIQFHYELNINIEGIDVIANLLNQITSLQAELNVTKNKLRMYEQE